MSKLLSSKLSIDAQGLDALVRLHDIIVEEVSLVDRAANKRRFLVVKRSGPSCTTEGSSMKLATGSKENILASLAKAIESAVTLVNKVKDADEVTDVEKAESIDEEILSILENLQSASDTLEVKPVQLSAVSAVATDKLKAIATIISSVADADSPQALESMIAKLMEVSKAEGAASHTLKQIGEVSMDLAEQVASGDDLSEETVEKISQLASSLNGLVKKQSSVAETTSEDSMKTNVNKSEDATEQTGATEDTQVTETASEKSTDADSAEASEDDAASVEEEETETAKAEPEAVEATLSEEESTDEPEASVEKAAAALASTILSEVSKSGKLSDARKQQLATAVALLTGAEVEKAAPAADPTPAQETDTDQLQAVFKGLEALQSQVKALAETPEAPASSGDETPTTTQTSTDVKKTSHRRGSRWVWAS